MLLAYAAVIAVSSVDGDGVSLRRGLRRGLPVIGAAGLAVGAGGGVTPALLPWLPGRAFSLKGAVAGGVVAAATAAALRRPAHAGSSRSPCSRACPQPPRTRR